MTRNDPSREGDFAKLIDEQLEIAAAKLPALVPSAVHPSPVDHEERRSPHPTFEDVLLGNAEASPEMLEELAALQTTRDLSDEELSRQALADADADNKPLKPT